MVLDKAVTTIALDTDHTFGVTVNPGKVLADNGKIYVHRAYLPLSGHRAGFQ
jgi:hypothetical protein